MHFYRSASILQKLIYNIRKKHLHHKGEMKREMNSRTKNVSISVGLILLLAVSALFASVSFVSASQYPDRAVGAYMAASPKLVGVGQTMTINMMVWPALEGPD